MDNTNTVGKEIHAYLNEDGTYRVTIITDATKEVALGELIKPKDIVEMSVEIPRVIIDMKILNGTNKYDNKLFTINVKE